MVTIYFFATSYFYMQKKEKLGFWANRVRLDAIESNHLSRNLLFLKDLNIIISKIYLY